MSYRVKKIREVIGKYNLDGFILFNSEYDNRANIQYLSNFTGSYCILLITKNDNYLITDSRYYVQAEEESDFTLVKQVERSPWNILKKIIEENKVFNLGYERDKLSVDKYLFFMELDNLKVLKGFDNLIIKFRAVKDEDELSKIRIASDIASEAFNNFYYKIKVGMKESELAAMLVQEMRMLGAEKPVKGHFVVASGKRGERPHGVFSDKEIENGDFITFDFGAVYKGYVSDVTRTIGIGSVDDKLVEIYNTVLTAQKKGIEIVDSTFTGEKLDSLVRKEIEDQGYGKFFTHSTGHGIGLEIHELPNINHTNKENLPVNSVFTIEPGIYYPGLGGVRIEDNVILKESGCEVLTGIEKELIVL